MKGKSLKINVFDEKLSDFVELLVDGYSRKYGYYKSEVRIIISNISEDFNSFEVKLEPP